MRRPAGERTPRGRARRRARSAWACLLVCSLALATAAPALAQTDEAATDLLTRAIRLLQEGEALEALLQIERALARDPSLWEAHLWQGHALQALGDDVGARDAFVRAARNAPGVPEAHFLAAAASLRMGDFDVAWEQAVRAAQAGQEQEMGRLLNALRELSDPPDDLDERLAALRLRVEPAPELDPGLARIVRQAVVEAPFLGLVRSEAADRLEVVIDDAGLLLRWTNDDTGVVLERRVPTPDSAADSSLVAVIGEIQARATGVPVDPSGAVQHFPAGKERP